MSYAEFLEGIKRLMRSETRRIRGCITRDLMSGQITQEEADKEYKDLMQDREYTDRLCHAIDTLIAEEKNDLSK
jgi:hypothetical protein